MTLFPYDRQEAVRYARRWALARNPVYYDFEHIGGDCTNFASQCIYAGSRTMNFLPVYGWYYTSLHDRAPAWTDVDYLYRFLSGNKGAGPFGRQTDASHVLPGDLVQLGKNNGDFYHCPVITEVSPRILVCAHSRDRKDVPLASYLYEQIRFVHIDGVRSM